METLEELRRRLADRFEDDVGSGEPGELVAAIERLIEAKILEAIRVADEVDRGVN